MHTAHHDHGRRHHHYDKEHPDINVAIELNNDPTSLIIDDCRGDVYHIIEHDALDDPANDEPILAVLRAIRDRCPNQFIRVADEYGGIPVSAAVELLDGLFRGLNFVRLPQPED